MNDTPAFPLPSRGSLALRAIRAVALLALCCIIAFLAVLAAAAVLNPFAHDDTEGFKFAMRVTLLAGLFLPLILVWLAYRLRLRSWWWLGGGYLAVAPVLAYLAADDTTIRRPMSIEEIAPGFPGAEESYRVFMRYAKDSPEGRAFKQVVWGIPREADKMPGFAEANRAKIDTVWADLAPVRAWYDELSAFDRIGDLGTARYDAPVPAFAVHRAMSQAAQLKATLLALDGRGDEAIAVLLPVLDVGRKMQVNSRTLVRSMIGLAMRRPVLDTVDFTLARAAVSPAMRARLLAALGPAGGEAGARRLVAIEYAYWTSGAVLSFELSPSSPIPAIVRVPLRLVAPLVVNPNRTINRVGDLMAEMQDRAAQRQPMGSRAQTAIANGPLPMKNLFGTMMAATSIPDYGKVIDIYWKTEDHLAVLRAQLAKD